MHKHQVPDFQVTVTVASDGAGGFAASCFLSLVDVDFRTGAAGTSVAHGPEIILFSQAEDSIGSEADVFFPVFECVIVILENRNVKTIFGQPDGFGEKLPSVYDGVLFEIIAEGKVAEHLEKSVVPGCAPDHFEVVVFSPGAHAFLYRNGPFGVPGFITEKNIFELDHARVGEKKSWVVSWYQGATRHQIVIAFLKIIQEFISEFVAGHSLCTTASGVFRIGL